MVKKYLFPLLIVCRLNFIIIFLYKIRFRIISKKKWVFGRVACLGTDSFNLINSEYNLYNIQKGRIDFLLESFKNGKSIIKPSLRLLKYIPRVDIKNLILNQFYFRFDSVYDPELLIMDSYAELTDQKFISKKNHNSFFFSNYSDVKENNLFHCIGLISTDNSLKDIYYKFFICFRSKYPDTPICYINFPKKLEYRPKYIDRHFKIKEIIHEVCLKFENFYVLDVPDEIITNSSDKFPYHYNKEVYEYLAKKINLILK